MVDLIELRRRAVAGDVAARAELRRLKDELAEVLEQLEQFRDIVDERAVATLELDARALAGDVVARAELERQRVAQAERVEVALRDVEKKRAEKEAARAAAGREKEERSAAIDASGAYAAAEEHVKAKYSSRPPEFLSKSARRGRPL
jgi:hypothetical protein